MPPHNPGTPTGRADNRNLVETVSLILEDGELMVETELAGILTVRI